MSTKAISIRKIATSSKDMDKDIQSGDFYIVVKNSKPIWRIIPYEIDIETILEDYEMRKSKNFKESLKKADQDYQKGKIYSLEQIKKLAI